MNSTLPVRIGIAGLGRSGWRNHALTLHSLAGKYQVVAVTDPNPDRCREATAQLGCRHHPDLNGLLVDQEVEWVVLATPSHLHCEQTMQAFAAGKSVVCEKPMAAGSEEARRMVEAARRADRLLTVFQQNRYMPGFVKMRQVIGEGKLGRIVQIRISIHDFGRRWDWQTLKEFNGGELNNTGPHFLDHALVLLGPSEPEIFCHLERTLTAGDAEDYVKILMRAKGAPLIDLEISKACAYPQDFWHVMGTHGGLRGNARELAWKYADFSKLPPRVADRNPTPDRSYNSEEYSWTEECWKAPDNLPNNSILFYQDLYKTIRQGAPLVVTPEQIWRQIGLIEQCHKLCPVV